jgi:ribose/xylose/arabinose/galactoside ABC-type transport system permease subunit
VTAGSGKSASKNSQDASVRPLVGGRVLSEAGIRGFLNEWGVVVALVVLLIVSTIVSDRFLTPPNLLNVMRQISIVGILAIGMTFVILTAGIDLSVGSMLAVVAVTTAGTLESYGTLPAVGNALMVGAMLGAVNGVGVTVGGVQPFIMTLGMLAFARGLAFIYTGGNPVPATDPTFLSIGNGRIYGVPTPAIILLTLMALAYFVLNRTTFGRSVYAVGSNEEAARLSGVPVRLVKSAVYVISGLTAGVAGLLYASQLGVGTPIAGEAFELDAIAATVVGGTSLFGGQGGIAGTFVGAAILGVLSNILNLAGVNPFVQRLFRGALIVFAVMIQRKDARGR